MVKPKYEPMSLLAAFFCVFGFGGIFISGTIGIIFMIIGAVLMSISYPIVKKEGYEMWPIYVALTAVGLKVFQLLMGLIASLV